MRLEIISRKPPAKLHDAPILFVHGACYAAWLWDEYFLPYFAAQGYEAHAVSLRGHGGSDGRKNLRSAELQDYADDIAQAVRKLGKSPILIGHSLGGVVVQEYLKKHSAPAAVLLASPLKQSILPFRATLQRFFYSFENHPLALLRRYATLNLYRFISNPRVMHTLLFSDDMPEAKVKAYAARMQEESLRVGFDIAFLPPLRPGELHAPIFLVGGENDKLVPADYLRETAQAYGAESYICPGVAHNMMLEARWRNVADRILEWLRSREF